VFIIQLIHIAFRTVGDRRWRLELILRAVSSPWSTVSVFSENYRSLQQCWIATPDA